MLISFRYSAIRIQFRSGRNVEFHRMWGGLCSTLIAARQTGWELASASHCMIVSVDRCRCSLSSIVFFLLIRMHCNVFYNYHEWDVHLGIAFHFTCSLNLIRRKKMHFKRQQLWIWIRTPKSASSEWVHLAFVWKLKYPFLKWVNASTELCAFIDAVNCAPTQLRIYNMK